MAMRQTASSAIPQRFSSTGKRVRSRILSFSERCQYGHHNAVQPGLPCYGPQRSAARTALLRTTTQCSQDCPATDHNADAARTALLRKFARGLAHGEQLGYHPDYNGANLEAKMHLFIGISR